MLIELIRNGSNYSVREVVLMIIVMFFALTVSFSFHEFMHAAVATWLGDDTPKLYGRVTMNPKAHLDPMGTILLLLVGFGWGKPVTYNPNNLRRFKSKRLMNIMVSLAGVTGNFIIALVSMCLIAVILVLAKHTQVIPYSESLMLVMNGLDNTGDIPFYAAVIIYLLFYTYMFSMSLLAFNLLPIPPLDGFHVVERLLPVKVTYSEGFRKFARYGPMVLMLLIVLGNFGNIDILGTIMDYISLPANIVIVFISTVIGTLGGL